MTAATLEEPKQFTVRLRDGAGNHYQKEGTHPNGDDIVVEYKAGDELKCTENLAQRWPEKFQLLTDEGKEILETKRRPGETMEQFTARMNDIIAREQLREDANADKTLESMDHEELLRMCAEEEINVEGIQTTAGLIAAIRAFNVANQ